MTNEQIVFSIDQLSVASLLYPGLVLAAFLPLIVWTLFVLIWDLPKRPAIAFGTRRRTQLFLFLVIAVCSAGYTGIMSIRLASTQERLTTDDSYIVEGTFLGVYCAKPNQITGINISGRPVDHPFGLLGTALSERIVRDLRPGTKVRILANDGEFLQVTRI